VTVQALPWAIQGQSHSGEVARNLIAAMFGAPVAAFSAANQPTGVFGSHGVVGSGDLVVAQNGTPNMSVNVAAGRAIIRSGGSSTILQGCYSFLNDATVNLAIAAADPTNPRNDLVVAQVRDSNYSEAAADARLTVITGTPAASPADPSLTSYPNCVVLARVRVNAATSSIVNANITDLRVRAYALGGTGVTISSLRPSSPYTTQLIGETDTIRGMAWDGAAWQVAFDLRNLQTWSAGTWIVGSVTNPTLGTGGSFQTQGEYIQIGKLVWARASITFGNTGNAAGSGNYTFALPTTPKLTGISTALGLGNLRISALASSNAGYFDGAVLSSTGVTFRYPSAWPIGADTLVGAAAPGAPIAGTRYEWSVLYETS
jgi:hypothetical protein